MMTNTGPYSPRIAQMTTSNMYLPKQNTQARINSGFTSTTTSIDPFRKPMDSKIQDSANSMFPRGLASYSMIDMNSTSSARKPAFGKLDSMARKVTPTFQEETLNQIKKSNEVSQFNPGIEAQSMIAPKNNFIKKFGNIGSGSESSNLQPDFTELVQKKRRESIDLGVGSKRQFNNQTLPFMRRVKGLQQNKLEISQDTDLNGENFKTKNFQFLKKRREALIQNQVSSSASMISGVQSMKNLQQFSPIAPVLKKSQFSTPAPSSHVNKFVSPVQCPQDNPKNEILNRDEFHGRSPGFQFKKKKLFQTPIEPLSSKTILTKQSLNVKKEPLTVKQKWALKNQRQIKVSDFQFLQKLGKGAFGDVYIAQEKAIGFICVIKKMSKKRIRQSKVEQHILRQIKIQSYLNDAHITSLFGCFHDEDNLYLILEALPDGSLQNVKKKKKLPQAETAAIVKQVADGLKYMHQQYLIHRDLKPQNLFMNEGVVKIGDFGCSIYNRELVLRNTVVGCLQYSSPEQLSKGGYSEKIDSWSLGILTYELLFGKSPFQSDIMKMAKNKEMKAELSTLNFPSGIPIKEQTKRFIQNLLNQDPDARMDMDEVLHHQFLKQQLRKKPKKLQQF